MEHIQAFVAVLFCGLILGAGFTAAYFLTNPVIRMVEISPSPASSANDQLAFYINVLRSQNYTVTEKDLTINTFENVNFKQFLWIIKEANITEVYSDKSEYLWFMQPVAKLWVQIDGVYYEVRFEK